MFACFSILYYSYVMYVMFRLFVVLFVLSFVLVMAAGPGWCRVAGWRLPRSWSQNDSGAENHRINTTKAIQPRQHHHGSTITAARPRQNHHGRTTKAIQPQQHHHGSTTTEMFDATFVEAQCVLPASTRRARSRALRQAAKPC